MPELLIVANWYAPEQTGIAPYTTGLAESLAGSGWTVTVVTGMPHYPQWKVQATYRGRLRYQETIQHVDVRRVRQYVPARQSALGRSLYEASFFMHALTQVGDCSPAAVLGVVPSLGGGVAAAIAARRHGAPLGLIMQDLVGIATSQSGMPGGSLASVPARSVESWMVRRADGIVIVTDAFRSYLERVGVEARRVRCVPNWSHVVLPTGCANETRASLGWLAGETIVLHAGNMGFKQDLDNVLMAARQVAAEGRPIRFVLMGDGNERARLERLAGGLSTVDFVDPTPGDLFMNVLAAADILLVNERPTVIDMSLPSKLTSYFASGTPVVAAVPQGGTTARELTRSGGALVVPAGNPSDLVEAIQLVADDPKLAAGLAARGALYVKEALCKDKLLAEACQFVAELPLKASR